MIGKLTGRLVEHGDGCLLDVNGVGYLLSCSQKTLDRLAATEGVVSVLVETQVRQDAITLYGFAQRAERDCFRRLTAIQGVGPKVALDILSALTPEQLAGAVRGGDKAALRQANGVGARLAERLVTELREWAGAMPALAATAVSGAAAAAAPPLPAGVEADAVSALLNLGMKRPEAAGAVSRVMARLGAGARLDAVIRDSLKELAR
ncbi:Holliday junction branch migration protein RuvA [Roseomonas sp. NAR14]|uniref:Holliday junction branch migration complex subunit RuvA n=1 Tax=Roseomonas acroporae TaxID=2937791 RepID=A0A9X1Y8C5_9PROT|nr:Holliday junction branch migration protein RuvA [Roseomonas acroporae]MCK8785403.1 Holliday junction branch migration protein RuvA [Roseomonas acroporae]